MHWNPCQNLYQMWARTLWGSPEFIKMSLTSPPPTMPSKSESASSKISSYCSLSSWGTTQFAETGYNTHTHRQEKNRSISKFSPKTHIFIIISCIIIIWSYIINEIYYSFSTKYCGQVQLKNLEKDNSKGVAMHKRYAMRTWIQKERGIWPCSECW